MTLWYRICRTHFLFHSECTRISLQNSSLIIKETNLIIHIFCKWKVDSNLVINLQVYLSFSYLFISLSSARKYFLINKQYVFILHLHEVINQSKWKCLCRKSGRRNDWCFCFPSFCVFSTIYHIPTGIMPAALHLYNILCGLLLSNGCRFKEILFLGLWVLACCQ